MSVSTLTLLSLLSLFLIPLVLVVSAHENCDDNRKVNFGKIDKPEPLARTECGSVGGKMIITKKGECAGYLAIPFAAPPIGQYRFQKPQQAKCWEGTLDGTKLAPTCIQLGNDGNEPELQSEDCLYLNVITPNNTTPSCKFPVMVSIHGGGFLLGSSREAGVDGLCENIVRRGVVMVTFQYRLHIYGFLSTGTKAAPGNSAIWDMSAALNWVKRNIAGFGGDPDNITIFGNSAGGTAAGLLSYVPGVKDLFHRVIMQSGCALSGNVPTGTSVKSTQKLSKVAGCDGPDDRAVVECLCGFSTVQLQQFYNSTFSTQWFSPLSRVWSIEIDNTLFTKLGPALIESSPAKPSIIGVNSMEFSPAWISGLTFDQAVKKVNPENDLVKQILQFIYIDSKGDRTNKIFEQQQSAKLMSDHFFRLPSTKLASFMAESDTPVWVYVFDYYSQFVFPPDFPFEKGAPHAHEMCYLYKRTRDKNAKDYPLDCPEEYMDTDEMMANHMGEIWTNFAIYGNPSPSKLDWPQFRNVSHANCLNIRPTLQVSPHFYLDVYNFWTRLAPNINHIFLVTSGATVPSFCPFMFLVFFLFHSYLY